MSKESEPINQGQADAESQPPLCPKEASFPDRLKAIGAWLKAHPKIRGLLIAFIIIFVICQLLKVTVPDDHLMANDTGFIITKSILSNVLSISLFFSDGPEPEKRSWIPLIRDLMGKQPSDKSGLSITTIPSNNTSPYKIAHILPDSLKSETQRKTVFYYHGGGMISGSAYSFPINLAKQRPDIQIFGVDYRYAPETPFPGPVQDCIDATRQILNDKEKYNIGNFSLFGDSAGGNLVLAMLLEIDFDSEFDQKPKSAQSKIPMNQLLRLDTPSYADVDYQFEISRRVMLEFWLLYAGIDKTEHARARELIKTSQHWDSTLRADQEFLSRGAPEVWAKEWVKKVPNYETQVKQVANKQDHTDKTDKKIADKISELLRNKLFAPGLASDEDLTFACNNVGDYVVSVAEYDVLRDDGVMVANRMKDIGCTNVKLHVFEKVGHMFYYESEKYTTGDLKIKEYNVLADKMIDLIDV